MTVLVAHPFHVLTAAELCTFKGGIEGSGDNLHENHYTEIVFTA